MSQGVIDTVNLLKANGKTSGDIRNLFLNTATDSSMQYCDPSAWCEALDKHDGFCQCVGANKENNLRVCDFPKYCQSIGYSSEECYCLSPNNTTQTVCQPNNQSSGGGSIDSAPPGSQSTGH